MSTNVQEVVAKLVASDGITVVLTSHISDGDRVMVSYEGVTAQGVVGNRSLHWSTMRGVNMLPVVLDGTEQTITVHASHVTKLEG